MKHSVPLSGDKESQKLNWLLSINDEFFRQQLHEVVGTPFSIFITSAIVTVFHGYLHNLSISFLTGFQHL